MAEKQIEVDTVQDFHDDDYGLISAHQRKTVRADVGKRWIEEGKACPVLESRGVVETPEDSLSEHETADLRRKKK